MSNLWKPIDPLGEALHYLRMSGVFYSRSECTAPWGIAVPPLADTLMFHVVTAGRCWLEVDGSAPQLVQPGELTLVPHGQGHRLVSEPGGPVVALFDLPHETISERYDILRIGGGGEPCSLICGVVRFDHPAAQQLVKHLPRVINVDAWREPELEWIPSTLRLLAAEAQELRPGGETVITRLADILVIQAMRWWLARDPAANTGWLGALRDRQVGQALALIHREPARAWTVADLASEVAMSRSALAARFTALVGEPPMQYVTRWRMLVAHSWLQAEGATLAELAERLGYQSEAAFSRAFKRYMGSSPGAVRRNGAAAERQGWAWASDTVG